MTKRIRPVTGYYGGKEKQAKKIVDMIPKHTVYVEPFCGAAAVLFAKPVPKIAPSKYTEVLNDIDGNLVNMYQQIQSDPDKFVDKLHTLPYSKELFDKSCEILRGNIKTNKFQRAIAYYINITCAFGNIYLGGMGRTTTRNVAYSWQNRKDALMDTVERMRNIIFEHGMWDYCMDRWESSNTTFYLDPPYVNSYCKAYTRQRKDKLPEFTLEDYKKLIDRLDQSPSSFILSNYPNENVTVPDDWKMTTYEKIMSATSTGKCGQSAWTRSVSSTGFKEANKRTEVLYFREAKGELGEQFKKIYASKAMDIFI